MADKKRTAAFDWEDVRYFLALARAGSLSAAARALRVNHATVARRIGALEAALGRVLFDRRADGYGLTAHGQAALETALAMERAAVALPESGHGGGFQGIVRVTTVPSLADLFLVDRLGALRKDHPGIALDVITDVRLMSLARREADIALRLGRPKDSGLIGRKLADVHYAFYAAPGVVAAFKAGKPVPLVGYDLDSEGVVEAAWMGKRYGGHAIAFRSNSNQAQAAAARAGFGVAMLPRYMGDADKRLRVVAFGTPHPARELWLLSPRELSRVPRVRAVLDAIARLVANHKALLAPRADARSGKYVGNASGRRRKSIAVGM
jgi:DNA-binding transcriptional LysR family regulator